VRIVALGRLEPEEGIRRVAGPSRPSVVLTRLLVQEGAWVALGQPLAVLDTQPENAVRVDKVRRELANATQELTRIRNLVRGGVASVAERDVAELKAASARSELTAAEATLEYDTVRSPLEGQVLAVHARGGERVSAEGIAEIAHTDRMYGVAQVYETDIGRVRLGQRAILRSPALATPLTGMVAAIGFKVGRMDMLNADPTARTDARVVEVRIRLDPDPRASRLSNLQVDVVITP
jgi:HlyD family secretion protein